MISKQKCTNCKHFSKHYEKTSNDRFVYTGGGSCKNYDVPWHESFANIIAETACNKWEQAETQTVDLNECIEDIIKTMKQRLDDIYALIRTDEQNPDE
ncbi:MAG: hypothetical protein K2I30_03400 [Clostridia bacterium]|nr:hypothetical protein [Clostridia bacterium]